MRKADILLGLQWGDEGKGKMVDVLTPKYDVVARFQVRMPDTLWNSTARNMCFGAFRPVSSKAERPTSSEMA